MMRRTRVIIGTAPRTAVSDRLAALYALRGALSEHGMLDLRTCSDDLMAVIGDYLDWDTALAAKMQDIVVTLGMLPNEDEIKAMPVERFLAEYALGQSNRASIDFDSHFFRLARLRTRETNAMLRRSAVRLERELLGQTDQVLRSVALLARMLKLDATDEALLALGAVRTFHIPFRRLLPRFALSDVGAVRRLYADMVAQPEVAIVQALGERGRMVELGVVVVQNGCDAEDTLSLAQGIADCLTQPHDTVADMVRHFMREAPPATLAAPDFLHLADDLRALARYLGGALEARAKGVNVLLYGRPGTGKTEFAKTLAREVGASLHEVAVSGSHGEAPEAKDRYASLRVSQAVLGELARGLVLFDEAEDVFGGAEARELGNLFGLGQASRGGTSKAWLNRFLETNPVPIIWVSNSIGQIDEAYLRRFSYHLEFGAPPQSVRAAIVRKHLAGMSVSDGFVGALAASEDITPAQIDAAARFARLSAGEAPEEAIARQLRFSSRALGRPAPAARSRSSIDYGIEYVNLEAPYSPERVIAAMRTHDRLTACFYGASGTGKTSLVEHMAGALGRPLMRRSTADLLSKWVGETEQRIAAMFQQAERDGALLFIDEADSLLADRRRATRNWEISQVNELLQRMERFDGILICATNLFEEMDEAVLRRFDLKIRFLPLSAEQRRFMLAGASGTEPAALPLHARRALDGMVTLTAGDFAVVARRLALTGRPGSVETWIEELAAEARLKHQRNSPRRMGFV